MGFILGAIVNFLNRKYIYFHEYIYILYTRRTESRRILSRTRKTIFSISGIRIGSVAFVWMQNRLSSTLFLIFGLAFNERYIHTHIKERHHRYSPTTSGGERKRQKRGWCVNFGESCSRRRRRRWRQKLFKTAKGMRLGCVCVCVYSCCWERFVT